MPGVGEGNEGGCPIPISGEGNLYTALLPLWGPVGQGKGKAGRVMLSGSPSALPNGGMRAFCEAENMIGVGGAQGGPAPSVEGS